MKYYSDVARVKAIRGSSSVYRLKQDAPCAMAALNVWNYSRSPYYAELRKKRACKKAPATV